VACLLLDEQGVGAVLDEVGDVGAAQGVHVQSLVLAQLVAVAAEPGTEGGCGHQRAALGREQVQAAAGQGEPAADPVADDLARPVEDGQHRASLGCWSGVRLAVAHVQQSVAAEPSGVGVAGEVHALQVRNLVAAHPQA